MKQLVTTGIVLNRTDYGEADRILVLLTPDQGKIHLVAKGVRKVKSKLAGGIELFSVSQITYMPGRSGSGLGTLISSRLLKYYKNIVQDINRTMLGYDLIKRLNKNTEDNPENDYFYLLQQVFEALDDNAINLDLIQIWFIAQLVRLDGHMPNLQTDIAGDKLAATAKYDFSYDDMTFMLRPNGAFGADEIKFLRLIFNGNIPHVLTKVSGAQALTDELKPLITTLQQLNGA